MCTHCYNVNGDTPIDGRFDRVIAMRNSDETYQN